MGEAAKTHLLEEIPAFNRESQTASKRHGFFVGFLILKKFLVKSDTFVLGHWYISRFGI